MTPRPLRPFAYALSLILLAAATATPAIAQQRALDHDDALRWNRITGSALSPNGAWLVYVLVAMEGDPVLHFGSAGPVGQGPSHAVRGTRPAFTSDSRFVVYSIPPVEAVVDSLKREGKRGDDLPPDSLGFAEMEAVFAEGPQPRTIGAVENFKVAGEGAWVAYTPVEDDEEEGESAEEEGAEEPEAEPEPEPEPEPEEEGEEEEKEEKKKDDGSPLVLLNLATGEEVRYEKVTAYYFAAEAAVLTFATSAKDGEGDGVFVVNLDDMAHRAVMEGKGNYRQLVVAEDGSQVAFLSDRDDYEADEPEFTLYHGAAPDWAGATMANSATAGVPAGWWVSENGGVRFSDGGGRIHFGTAPRPEPEEEDETLDEDKVTLDIWNWKDPYLQPMQLVQAGRERNRTYAAVAHLDGGTVVQLGTEEVPDVNFPADGDTPWAVGISNLPHRQLVSWDGRYNDYYAIDVATGERRLIAERTKGFASPSPSGRYVSWWDGAARHWMVAPLAGGDPVAASAGVPHAVWNELDDHPDLPPSYGSAGWTEDDEAFLFYDRHDVWRFEPATGETTNVTAGAGRAGNMRFRYTRTDFEDPHLAEGEALWGAFHYRNKQSGFYRGRTDREAAPERIVMADKAIRFNFGGHADDADRWLMTRQDFREFPDLWVTDGEITDMVRLTDANPQQAGYRWGTAEIAEWTSNDGTPLQGILIKPDGFDPTQKYPMMVYFYERSSDGLHSYRSPTPGGSSISYSFYASRGYVVFVPDIPYEVGYPGESALDAVVPGVLSIVAQGYVDREKIGVQGHSWGGYQIAYMITKTNLFAAAEAGAPVSNMTSAYGGIRWASGMSRMFQYERTQSRIGGTLWESTAEYIHNSPVFYADKIHTPLLMMHNDEDGAVPWYQGIEMFVAMRRLAKPVWMLNYNGQGHGLSREADRKDWAIRMQQFFDHYLMDAPAPIWMEEGVPAILKGKETGLGVRAKKIS
ncbi:MAG: prolyl oligopeptidase family serine peptidase [Gemmatimonadota bacterium]|nr:prolyl oligopeptidase family serine peptidase [Gemmatimonadota bacterium]